MVSNKSVYNEDELKEKYDTLASLTLIELLYYGYFGAGNRLSNFESQTVRLAYVYFFQSICHTNINPLLQSISEVRRSEHGVVMKK